MKNYRYITSNDYLLTADTNLIQFNKENNTIKFKQITYTIISVGEQFNGFVYETVYKAEAIRTGANKTRKYNLTVAINEDFDTCYIERFIYEA